MKLGVSYLLCICFLLDHVLSSVEQQRQRTKVPSPVASFKDSETGVHPDSRHKTTHFIFEGEFHHATDTTLTLPASSSENLVSFFQDPKHRDLALKGGGNPIDPVPITPQLYEEWNTQSRIVQSTAPDTSNDRTILAIHSTVSLLPGLAIKAVSITGCKLLQHPVTSLPSYEFTLIKEDYHPEGVKPMVWIFNIVAGRTGAHPSDVQSRNTHAISRISVERVADSKTGALRLCYFGRVKVDCSLPRRLMKCLPLSKQKMEAKVSKSIVKQLEREGVQSVKKFRAALEDWLILQQ
jgi:hypothetical protein